MILDKDGVPALVQRVILRTGRKVYVQFFDHQWAELPFEVVAYMLGVKDQDLPVMYLRRPAELYRGLEDTMHGVWKNRTLRAGLLRVARNQDFELRLLDKPQAWG